ncbi:MAG: hypothetical protein ACKPKO_40300, partial [Candidatus Fonsibacter sp.]
MTCDGIIPHGSRDIWTVLYFRSDQSANVGDAMFIYCCCEHASLMSKPVNRKGVSISFTKEPYFAHAKT